MNLMSVGERETKPQGREKTMKTIKLVRVTVDVEVNVEDNQFGDGCAKYIAVRTVRHALEFARNSDVMPLDVETAMVTGREVVEQA
jgi:hypothetical protein